MPSQEVTITLSIREAGTSDPGAYLFHVLVDGEAVSSNQSLPPDEAAAVRDLSDAFNAFFEERHAGITAESLRALGNRLFRLWLAHVWDQVTARVPAGARRILVIASDVPEVLNLPWESLYLPGGDFVGFQPQFEIRRLPWPDRTLAPFAGLPRPGPLRILFQACAPQDELELDYEREEEHLMRAIAKAGPDVVFDSGDLGTFEELRQRINEFQPHVVHLVGHGTLGRKCPRCQELNAPASTTCTKRGCAASLEDVLVLGYFAFEDERGHADLRSSVEIGQQLFGGSDVQCAFISGCQTGQAPPGPAVAGICQGLVKEEVPLAIGWAAPIADDIAIDFAATFYNTLASGQSVGRAFLHARHAIRKRCEERNDPSWTLPVLYAASTQGLVVDPDPSRPRMLPARPGVVLRALPGMTEGYAEQFVGRRRELQRLLPALREGTLQTVLITGLGGTGKSTLATRVARKLEAERFRIIPVPSSQDTPLSTARLLRICGDAFLEAGLRDAYDRLGDTRLPVDARLRSIVTTLNRERFVLVLDNFETNLDEATRRVIDADLAGFYTHLVTHLSGDSRALITSRYRPADPPDFPPVAREEALGDFAEATFIKFLLRDPTVERRYHAGELPHDLLRDLHRLLGGVPRFLAQVREVLKTITADELQRQLQTVELPGAADTSRLQATRDRYCEQIFTARLYAHLSPPAQRALSRAAVYQVPVSVAGLAAVTGEAPETLERFTRQWQDFALVYPESEGAAGPLWTVYGLLRGWLLAPERLGQVDYKAASLSAGNFLIDLAGRERLAELGLNPLEADLEARVHYLSADAYELARAVTERVSRFLVRRGLYRELARLNEDTLAYEEHPRPMAWIARSYLHRGDYALAMTWYQRCLAASDALPAEAAVASNGLAMIALEIGDYTAARAQFQKALVLSEQGSYQSGIAAALHGLATIDLRMGDYRSARENLSRSLEMKQQIGDLDGEAATWHQLAVIDVHEGAYEAGRVKCQNALAISQKTGDRAAAVRTSHALAAIDIETGNHAAAEQRLREIMVIDRETGDRAGEAAAWHGLGSIDLDRGDLDAARIKFERALAIRQEIGDLGGQADTLQQLGTVYLHRRDQQKAREILTRALAIRQQVGDRAGEAATWHQLGVLAATLGRVAEAARLVAIGLLISDDIGHVATQRFKETLAQMGSQLNYTTVQFEAVLREVAEAHQTDGGWALLAAAFPQPG